MLRFDEFSFDPATGELRRRDGTIVPLEPQPARVLAMLAGRPGSLLTRDELRATVWPEGTFVAFDQGLNYCIRRIRAALGDDARRPIFIETVARRGYRFLPRVEGPRSRRPRRAAAAAAIAAGLVAALWIAERVEGASCRGHHEAAVGFLKAVHDVIF